MSLTAPAAPIEPADDGALLVHLHISPRASRTEVKGLHGGRVKLTVAAPPVDGAANKAIIAYVARTLGLAREAVTLTRGASGRRKTLHVQGATPSAAAEALGLDAH